ncbi:MAG: FtsQ-type POTRA domain-containing protein [Actinomycetota bacterium]|nr:FtsQ-type POTRA domain-containing protein [Actinomycetota bacterium]
MVTLDTKPDPELASSRKRFARRQWARRWLAWRRLLVAALLLVLAGSGVYAVYFSSLLAVEGAEVRGLESLTVADIMRAAEVPVGEPLATVDLTAVERKVSSLGEVRSVEVSRQWPHDLLIEVEERVPVAVVRLGDQLRNLDSDGVIFGDRKRQPGNLPVVETDTHTDSDALREAAAVAGALEPAFLATVDHLEVATLDQITLVLRDGRIVQWGSAEQSEEKAEVLSALLSRQAEVYDVSVPGSPTTGPHR